MSDRVVNAPKKQTGLALGVALLGGGILRFLPGALTDFPVNDGGMLFAMIRDLKANGFLLPLFTSYNFSRIPFAYPPLGMYIGAVLSYVFSIAELDILHWLPAIVSTASIPAFYWLAWQIFEEHSKAAITTLLYAFLPGASDWLVMGGGLTRSFGILFSLLAIGSAYRVFRCDIDRPFVLHAAFFAALAILSHPEVGLQTAGIYFMLWILYGRNVAGVKNASLVLLGVALLTSPWWLTVLYHHGFMPFQSAAQTGIRETLLASLFHAFFSVQGNLPVLPVFSLIGIYAMLRKQEVLLILWAFLPFFVDPRNAPAVALFPLLMLATEGLYYCNREFTQAYAKTFSKNQQAQKFLLILTPGILAGLLLYLFLVSSAMPARLAALSLSVSDRETLQWVRKNTPPESRFLLMTNSGNISPMTDAYQEWFPALAERRSVNTLQGMEWIIGSNFFPYSQRLVVLQACSDVDCLDDWLRQNNVQVDFILLQTKRANQMLIDSLRADNRFVTVYKSTTTELFGFLP